MGYVRVASDDMGATQSRPEGSSLLLGRFDRPAAPATTLAVLADPHVTPDADGTWKCYHRTEDLLRRAVADVNASGADAAVVAGDRDVDVFTADPSDADSLERARVDTALERLLNCTKIQQV